jgi:hypothetical protein
MHAYFLGGPPERSSKDNLMTIGSMCLYKVYSHMSLWKIVKINRLYTRRWVYITFYLILDGLCYIIAKNKCVTYPSSIPCDITVPASCEFCNTPYVYLEIQMYHCRLYNDHCSNVLSVAHTCMYMQRAHTSWWTGDRWIIYIYIYITISLQLATK